jgi:hypothetical protein
MFNKRVTTLRLMLMKTLLRQGVVGKLLLAALILIVPIHSQSQEGAKR